MRYSLPEMLKELEIERAAGSFAMEKLDQTEISKISKLKLLPAVQNPKSNTFVESVLRLENFDMRRDGEALGALRQQHRFPAGGDRRQTPQQGRRLQHWADSMNVAYVDPFASVITDEAVSKIPLEVAKKSKSIGLYVLDGVLTVAMADPLNVDLVKRLGQIAEMPISPVFALPREIEDAICDPLLHGDRASKRASANSNIPRFSTNLTWPATSWRRSPKTAP